MIVKEYEASIYGESGINEYGSTIQTVLLARQLYRSDEARTALRKALNSFDEQFTYSNQDFDMKSGLAATLADMIRREVR